jgi:hypothetical protein
VKEPAKKLDLALDIRLDRSEGKFFICHAAIQQLQVAEALGLPHGHCQWSFDSFAFWKRLLVNSLIDIPSGAIGAAAVSSLSTKSSKLAE